MTRITDAAVEAAARALFVDQEGDFIQSDAAWLSTFEVSRRPKYTRRARAALEAAAPHLEGATPDWTDEERGFVETALAAADAGNAGHWPTVATYLAAEVRRLRAYEGATPAIDREALIQEFLRVFEAGGLWDGLEPDAYKIRWRTKWATEFADMVLALIGRAS